MNRVFARSEEAVGEFCAVSRENIGVVGLSAGAGSTLVATSLAYLLSRDKARNVAFVEAADYARGGGLAGSQSSAGGGGLAGLKSSAGSGGLAGSEPRGCLYDAMGMEKRFAMREYRDIFGIAETGRSIRQTLNLDDRINWAVPVPIPPYGHGEMCREGLFDEEKDSMGGFEHTPDLQAERADTILRVITGIAGDTVICDIGSAIGAADSCGYSLGNYREFDAKCAGKDVRAQVGQGFGLTLNRVLSLMDTVICVVDPAPSALLAGEQRLKIIKQYEHRGGKCVYLVNKMSAGVDKRELYGFLGISRRSAASDLGIGRRNAVSGFEAAVTGKGDSKGDSKGGGFGKCGVGAERSATGCVELDALPLAELHAAEYACRLPIESKGLRSKIKPILEEIFHRKNT